MTSVRTRIAGRLLHRTRPARTDQSTLSRIDAANAPEDTRESEIQHNDTNNAAQRDESAAPEVPGTVTDSATTAADSDDGQPGGDIGSGVPLRRTPPRVRSAVGMGMIIVAALAGLVGWMGFRAFHSHQVEQQRAVFLQVGRQGALNLTTIDYTEIDADMQRILDSSTGKFHDDFQQRSQPFVDVVKQAQSKSEGTVAEAGLESVEGDHAQVLVAVSVKTATTADVDQQPRAWRMRISLQKAGDGAKVSNVEFVP